MCNANNKYCVCIGVGEPKPGAEAGSRDFLHGTGARDGKEILGAGAEARAGENPPKTSSRSRSQGAGTGSGKINL